MPRCLLWAEGAKDSFRLGPEQPGPPPVNVRGQPAGLLAWLLGRGGGSTLTVAGDYPLPALPPWR